MRKACRPFLLSFVGLQGQDDGVDQCRHGSPRSEGVPYSPMGPPLPSGTSFCLLRSSSVNSARSRLLARTSEVTQASGAQLPCDGRCSDRVESIRCDLVAKRQRSRQAAIATRCPCHPRRSEFHSKEPRRVFRVNVEHGDNILVMEVCCKRGFGPKTFGRGLVDHETRVQNF